MEKQVKPLGKTRGDMAKESNARLSTVDRIALAAIFVVAILIVVMFGLTTRAAMQQIALAAPVAMSSYIGLPVSELDGRMPTVPTTAGKN